MEFKVGDEVICTERRHEMGLKGGHLYTVKHYEVHRLSGEPMVALEDIEDWLFSTSLFRPLSPFEAECRRRVKARKSQTEWVVTPAAVEIIAKEQERDQIEAELRAAIENMIKLQERAKEIAAAETPHPAVSAIDIMHRSARRMPNRWPEF